MMAILYKKIKRIKSMTFFLSANGVIQARKTRIKGVTIPDRRFRFGRFSSVKLHTFRHQKHKFFSSFPIKKDFPSSEEKPKEIRLLSVCY